MSEKKRPRTEKEKEQDHEQARRAVEKKIKKKYPNLNPDRFEVI